MLFATAALAPSCTDPGESEDVAREASREDIRGGREEEATAVDENEFSSDLAALGYVDYVDEPAVRELETATGAEREALLAHVETGLVERDARLADDGYTLMAALPQGRALLVAPDGEIVREWRSDYDAQWKRVALAPNCDLLVVGVRRSLPEGSEEADDGIRYLERRSPEGEVLWRRDNGAHHDISSTPSGDLLTLTQRARTTPHGEVYDEALLLLSPDGGPVLDVSLLDLLEPLRGEIDLEVDAVHAKDVLHANSIRWMTPGPNGNRRVLVSIKHIDLVVAVDLDDERVLWHFGQGELEYQHEATELPNGNVLVFDNGSKARRYSRLVEFDPETATIVWEYRADPPSDFWSVARGTAHLLPNGNVVAADSNRGEVFEVTRDGRRVWQFRLRDERGRRVPVRATRYPREFVAPLLSTDPGN